MTAIPKPRPKLLDKRKAKADIAKVDREENAKVKARSKGECEVREVVWTPYADETHGPGEWQRWSALKCHRRAGHIHHLRSGIGIRNHGDSIKARCKLHVCELHHDEIHGHVLTPESTELRYDAKTVRYERVR